MQSKENERSQKSEAGKFSGGWIPAGLLSSSLNDSEKLLLSFIYNLSGKHGCQAGNNYFSQRLGWNYRKTERIVTSLKAGGWINISASGSRYRRIYPTLRTIGAIDTWEDTYRLLADKSVGLEINESELLPDESVGPMPTRVSVYSDKNINPTPTQMSDIYIRDNNNIEKGIENVSGSEFQTPGVVEEKSGVEILNPSKGKKKKAALGKIVDEQFERSWEMFERYGSKKKALEYWANLSREQRDEIESRIPDYVASTPGCEFRKMFEGWINPDNELWRRPVIRKKPDHQFSTQARNKNIARDLRAFRENPEMKISTFERDMEMAKRLFDF